MPQTLAPDDAIYLAMQGITRCLEAIVLKELQKPDDATAADALPKTSCTGRSGSETNKESRGDPKGGQVPQAHGRAGIRPGNSSGMPA